LKQKSACYAAQSCQAQYTEESMKSVLVASFVILALFSGLVNAQDNIENPIFNMFGREFKRGKIY